MQPLIDLISVFEGLRLKSYQCPAGIWTIGYGSTGSSIGPGLVWTKAQAEERMRADAAAHYANTRRLCGELVENQLLALADFSYNLGMARLAGSTLRRLANAGDISRASGEFEKWIFSRGRKLPGLIIRRHAERLLFLSTP